MKTIGLALLTLVACGSGRDAPNLSNPQAAAPAVPGLQPAPQSVTVRLLGVGASGAVRVRVAAIELTLDGRALPARLEGGELDLGNDQQAWQVTMLGLPADAHKLAINLQLQPEGSVERNGKSQALDLRGPPISLVADAAQIRTNGHVVLEIDVARSLIDRGGQVFLLPDFIVRY
jgi:hypothetical protein